jgi:hypothetical protein
LTFQQHVRPVVLAVLGSLALDAALPTAAQAGVQSFSPIEPAGEQEFTVPAGVRSIHVVAVGASGGGPNSVTPIGGFGAVATADIPVTPGQTLYVEVGGSGGRGQAVGGGTGGFNGGGSAGNSHGGGGGGASDVRTISRGSPGTLASRLVTAGGGGGTGGSGGTGGDAGEAGADGQGTFDCMTSPDGGGGGTAGAPGGGGAGAEEDGDGQTGGLGIGGAGGQESTLGTLGGGGGGGGVFGGGGGGGGGSPSGIGEPCTGAGGGGGSSGFVNTATNTSVTTASTGADTITISWTEPPDTTLTAGPEDGSTLASASPTFEFDSAPAGLTFECQVDGGGFTACASPQQIGPLADGPHTFTVRAVNGGSVDPTPASRSFTIDAPPPPPGATKKCTVPRIARGTRLRAVKQRLAAAGCKLGKITRRPSAKVKRGRLIRMKARPGALFPLGAAIDAVLSKGPS